MLIPLVRAAAMRSDDDPGRPGDRYGRRDDFLSSRPDRASGPPREDLPLPTQPPYTAFVGNLAFDLNEPELEDFFASSKPKSVKIIRDRDDKPKGFGYVEFEDLEGLKDAIAKTGSSFSGRTIRVSVAEAPKERPGFGGSDDSKFDSPWRRDGPLPDGPSRDPTRRRFDGPREGGPREPPLPSVAEGASDWRSSKPRAPAEPEPRRKNIGFGSDNAGAADREETWTIGGKFKASEDAGPPSRFGGRGKGDMGPPSGREPPPPSVAEGDSDWRSSRRPTRDSTSPNTSTPPTPQMGRRKLELLPRTGSASNVASPLSSPKIGPTPSASGGSSRSNPFGAARPVDVTSREKEVAERLDKDRERLSMSRTSSRTGMERTTSRPGMERTSSRPGTERPPIVRNTSSNTASSPTSTNPPAAKTINPNLAANVRPAFSFANAAANKGEQKKETQNGNGAGEEGGSPPADDVADVRDQLGEVTI
ncbi:Eukaryotic translation initiation factor 4B [Marasmius sp. AFHP31]|nr:Eukaryotic translation initiation factor 4B [Marasmius sp. AFHP31]